MTPRRPFVNRCRGLWRRAVVASIVLCGTGASGGAGMVFARPADATQGQQRDFFRAVQMDDARTVKSLLGTVDPNRPDPLGGEPALVEAAREGSLNVLAVLLAYPGTRVDAPAVNGNTALMMAAYKGNRAAVDALLAKGAAVNPPMNPPMDPPGWTPLHYAAAGGDNGIAAVLLQRGARVDAVSPPASGAYTPLMMAAREGKEASALFLLEHGANPLLTNSEGLTAAQIADRSDHKSIGAALRAREKVAR